MPEDAKDLAIKTLAKRVQGMDDYNLAVLMQVCLFETATRFPNNFTLMIKDAIENVLNNKNLVNKKSIDRLEEMF